MKIEDLKNAKNKAGIYYLRDIVNNKYFIGQTIRVKNKLEKYFSIKKAITPVELAIEKFGIENFDFKILEYVEESDLSLQNKKLIELEKHYILQFNSNIPDGYNQTVTNTKVDKVLDSSPVSISDPNYFLNIESGKVYISSMDNINYIILDENDSTKNYIQLTKEAYNNYNKGLQSAILDYLKKFLKNEHTNFIKKFFEKLKKCF